MVAVYIGGAYGIEARTSMFEDGVKRLGVDVCCTDEEVAEPIIVFTVVEVIDITGIDKDGGIVV